ncbi:hypothetical protein LSTR_LSTR004952 [Laodelphax striatellus]|uniref:Uncharacterized protein n=1 Tax=Laodelphax striatellus TaxID=195883 RepID=A0A482XN06_LAOST|nr:hypothetical protein LSTR_LSTR004952 [Laodelphax striatellus]
MEHNKDMETSLIRWELTNIKITSFLKVGFRYCGSAADPDTTSQDGGQIRSLGTPLLRRPCIHPSGCIMVQQISFKTYSDIVIRRFKAL